MQVTGRQIAKGAAWMVLFKLVERGLGLISTIILARLLLPQDFGLIAMAMSVIAVLELLGAFSFDLALIHNSNAEDRHYDTAWTFNVIFSTGSALLLLLLSVPTSVFYDEPRLVPVMCWLAVGFAAQGFENIGIVNFRKNMEFDKEFKFLFSKKIASFGVTVPLAFILHSYWALVIGTITGRLVGVAMSYVVSKYRPRLSLNARHELFHFSKWLFINNILFFLRNHSADFVVGKLGGSHALGIYSIGYEISNLPTTELVAPINRAVFPGFAKMAHDLNLLRQSYLNVVSITALLTMPAAFGIAVTADLIVPVFLGSNWTDAVPLIQILAFYGALMALISNPIFLALGKPRMTTFVTLGLVIMLLPAMIVLTKMYGAVGAAWACLGSVALIVPVSWAVLFHDLQLKFSHYISAIWRVFAACAVMVAAVLWQRSIGASPTTLGAQIAQLSISVILGAFSYGLTLLAAWAFSGRPDGAEKSVLDLLKQKLHRRA